MLGLGNIGIGLGMVAVAYLVTHVLGGPVGYEPLPARFTFGAFSGWRPIFPIFAIQTLLMALAYWFFTSLSGAAAASVVKLIPTYFKHVGAACGFTMTVTLAASKHLLGGYTAGFVVWALMNAAAFYVAYSRVGFRHARSIH